MQVPPEGAAYKECVEAWGDSFFGHRRTALVSARSWSWGLVCVCVRVAIGLVSDMFTTTVMPAHPWVSLRLCSRMAFVSHGVCLTAASAALLCPTLLQPPGGKAYMLR